MILYVVTARDGNISTALNPGVPTLSNDSVVIRDSLLYGLSAPFAGC